MFFNRSSRRPSNPKAAREWENAVVPPTVRHGCAAPTPEDMGAFEEDALSLEDAQTARDPSGEARYG
jgi:hypothetical protein